MKEEDNKKCLVKHKFYDFYYKDGSYIHSPKEAISYFNQIPEHIKNDDGLEILFLDGKEALELLAEEGYIPPKV